jgi:hypothetical protein
MTLVKSLHRLNNCIKKYIELLIYVRSEYWLFFCTAATLQNTRLPIRKNCSSKCLILQRKFSMAATSGLSLKTFGYGIALPIGLAILGNTKVTNPLPNYYFSCSANISHFAYLVGLWLCQDPRTLFLPLHWCYFRHKPSLTQLQ